MIRRGVGVGLLIVAVLLASAGIVSAQGDEPLPPCEGESVSGTVVEVDEATGTVTVQTETGLCTVTLAEDGMDHPIASLLGAFFGDVSIGDLVEALETVQGCAVEQEGGWLWSPCEAEGAVPVRVVGEKEGAFVALMEDGTEVVVTVEGPGAAEALSDALETLAVEWRLDGEGNVVPVSEEIAAYHEEGIGFGVLVKLYAMASALPDVTVDDLVAAFQSGMGIGEIFHEYGRPSVLGVGHAVGRGHSGDRHSPPDHAGPPSGEDHPGRGHGWGRTDHPVWGSDHPGRGRGRDK
ncbi:MAG TPA: hypothetical protein ENK08_04785 [Chloroflexi bacterium]|nr:hypothetical protein [Chloroflexota bacterium]